MHDDNPERHFGTASRSTPTEVENLVCGLTLAESTFRLEQGVEPEDEPQACGQEAGQKLSGAPGESGRPWMRGVVLDLHAVGVRSEAQNTSKRCIDLLELAQRQPADVGAQPLGVNRRCLFREHEGRFAVDLHLRPECGRPR